MDRADLCECGHPRLDEDEGHRNGTRGCRVPGCGCARFQLAAATTPEPVDLDLVVTAAEPAPEPAVKEPEMPKPAPAAVATPAIATPAGEWARQAELLATVEQERDHARRLLQDGWDALADPKAANLSAGIVALHQAHGASKAELNSRGARLDAALKRAGELEQRADRADALEARLTEIEAGGVDLLLHRAEGYDLDRVVEARTLALARVDHLRQALETADLELQIRGEIGELEGQLEEKRLRLQALAGPADHRPQADNGQPPRRPLPAPVRVIREWAWAEQIPVSANGVPKQEVVDAYIAAHPDGADA